MAKLLMALVGLGCPNCDGSLVGPTGAPVRTGRARLDEWNGALVCSRCHASVDPLRGRWRFPLESRHRRLPGLLGWLWREPAEETPAA